MTKDENKEGKREWVMYRSAEGEGWMDGLDLCLLCLLNEKCVVSFVGCTLILINEASQSSQSLDTKYLKERDNSKRIVTDC
jgi:hypothetical protein